MASMRENQRSHALAIHHWRADYAETCTVSSEGGRRKKGYLNSTSPAAYPTILPLFGGQIPARYHEVYQIPLFTVVIVPCSFLTILLFLLLGTCSENP
jgi:hypothetical protein